MEGQHTVQTACPACGTRYRVSAESAGKKFRCKKCGGLFSAPPPGAAPPKTSGLPPASPATGPASEPLDRAATQNEGPRSPGGERADGRLADAKFARLAAAGGFVTPEQLKTASIQVEMAAAAGQVVRLRDAMVQRKYLTAEQVEWIEEIGRFQQRRLEDQSLAEVAREHNFVEPHHLEQAFREQETAFRQNRTTVPILDILVELGQLSALGRTMIMNARQTAAAPVADPPEFVVTVTDHGLRAFLTLRKGSAAGTGLDALKAFLDAQGLVQGRVDDDELLRFLRRNTLDEPFLVALGIPPRPARDGQVQWAFDPALTRSEKKVREFRPGELLAQVLPPQPGQAGQDVSGQPIPSAEPQKAEVHLAEGVERSGDGSKILAAVGGRPWLSLDGDLWVLPDYPFSGNLDANARPFPTPGHLVVRGAVTGCPALRVGRLEAMEIHDSSVDALGDVVVEGGVINADIRTQGSLRARFVQNSRVEACGDVTVETGILDSQVLTTGACRLAEGRVASSRIAARKGAFLSGVGSRMASPSEVRVGTNDHLDRLLEPLDEAIAGENCALSALASRRETLAEYLRTGSVETEAGETLPETNEAAEAELTKLAEEIRGREHRVETLGRRRDKLAAWAATQESAAVAEVQGEVFDDTRFVGAHASLTLAERAARLRIEEVAVDRAPGVEPVWEMKVSKRR